MKDYNLLQVGIIWGIIFFIILFLGHLWLSKDFPRIENREYTIPVKEDVYKAKPCVNSEGVPIECKG